MLESPDTASQEAKQAFRQEIADFVLALPPLTAQQRRQRSRDDLLGKLHVLANCLTEAVDADTFIGVMKAMRATAQELEAKALADKQDESDPAWNGYFYEAIAKIVTDLQAFSLRLDASKAKDEMALIRQGVHAFVDQVMTMHNPVRRETQNAPPGGGDTASVSNRPQPSGFTVSTLREMTGLGNTTMNRYAKAAGVKTPGRGQRSFRYSLDDVKAILRTIIDTCSEEKIKSRCRAALKGLPEITD